MWRTERKQQPICLSSAVLTCRLSDESCNRSSFLHFLSIFVSLCRWLLASMQGVSLSPTTVTWQVSFSLGAGGCEELNSGPHACYISVVSLSCISVPAPLSILGGHLFTMVCNSRSSCPGPVALLGLWCSSNHVGNPWWRKNTHHGQGVRQEEDMGPTMAFEANSPVT